MQLRSLILKMWWRLLTIFYSRHFRRLGEGSVIKGICHIRNAGVIEIGANCIIDSSWARPVQIDVGKGALLSIGSNVYINQGVSITCHVGVRISDSCLIASEVQILDDDGHPVGWSRRHEYWPDGPDSRLGAPIVLERNTWIASRAILLKGVTVGAGSVVGAGAVVTQPVPSKVLAVGVPAVTKHELPS